MSKRDRQAAEAAAAAAAAEAAPDRATPDPAGVEQPGADVVDVTEGASTAAGGAAADDGAAAVAASDGQRAGPTGPDEGVEGTQGGDGDGDLVAEAAQVVEDDLAALARERDDYLDALRRLQADFENFKKRSIRQQTEALDRAAEGLVARLLPVLDAIDLARQHGAGEGVEQIANALLDVLTKEGLERVGEPGDAFDPNLHEAVAHEEGDGGEATLAEVMRAGWSWKGRLLRAAMVKVRG